MRRAAVAVGMLTLLLVYATTADASSKRPFTLTSSAFGNNGTIPVDYTCKGAGKSPALAWTNVPSGT
jgi:Raf kinase inhibitor-like YbhB/YbcL family protein